MASPFSWSDSGFVRKIDEIPGFNGKNRELVQALAMAQTRNIGLGEPKGGRPHYRRAGRAPAAVIDPRQRLTVGVRDLRRTIRASLSAGDRSARAVHRTPRRLRPRGQRSAIAQLLAPDSHVVGSSRSILFIASTTASFVGCRGRDRLAHSGRRCAGPHCPGDEHHGHGRRCRLR